MTVILNMWQRIRSITLRQIAFAAIGVVVLLILFIGVAYVWDYTNSPQFCGTTCHTMPPEYNAWQRSPHARVACVDCHIGRDFITTTFTRKAGDLMHVIRYSSGTYHFPLYAKSMIPARESCERCHWPEKFSNDRSVAVRHFESDEKNSLITTYLMMKTGGGLRREGRGLGIHWHIENKVDFIALDELRQEIPWVQVTGADGQVTTYMDVQHPLTPDEISRLPKIRMDCIDCHNRVSHTFRNPEQAVDQALSFQRIDPQMPAAKKQVLQVLTGTYVDFAEADRAIDQLNTFYTQNYPDYARTNADKLKQSVEYIKTLYRELVYPTQDLSWTTHPDNIGHREWPGCFRCHDGKHFTADNKQAVRLECNICHTIPEVAVAGGAAPVVSLERTDEPESHKTTTWLAEHRSVFNTTCQVCHDTNNAGGKDNSSFCANSACHGQEWKFVGLNAPNLSKIFKPPVPPASNPTAPPSPIPHPIGGNPDCLICHGQNSIVRPFPSDHNNRPKDSCLACHKPAVPSPAATPLPGTGTGGPPRITHDTAGRTNCLGCHGTGAPGIKQITQFHKDFNFTNNNCLTCHKTTTTSAAQPTVAPTVRPTTAPTVAPTSSAPTVAPTVAPTTRPTVAPTVASTSSASSSAATSSAASSTASTTGGIKPLPASHAGRTTCIACHGNNIGPKLPADHAGRTDATCGACHK